MHDHVTMGAFHDPSKCYTCATNIFLFYYQQFNPENIDLSFDDEIMKISPEMIRGFETAHSLREMRDKILASALKEKEANNAKKARKKAGKSSDKKSIENASAAVLLDNALQTERAAPSHFSRFLDSLGSSSYNIHPPLQQLAFEMRNYLITTADGPFFFPIKHPDCLPMKDLHSFITRVIKNEYDFACLTCTTCKMSKDVRADICNRKNTLNCWLCMTNLTLLFYEIIEQHMPSLDPKTYFPNLESHAQLLALRDHKKEQLGLASDRNPYAKAISKQNEVFGAALDGIMAATSLSKNKAGKPQEQKHAAPQEADVSCDQSCCKPTAPQIDCNAILEQAQQYAQSLKTKSKKEQVISLQENDLFSCVADAELFVNSNLDSHKDQQLEQMDREELIQHISNKSHSTNEELQFLNAHSNDVLMSITKGLDFAVDFKATAKQREIFSGMNESALRSYIRKKQTWTKEESDLIDSYSKEFLECLAFVVYQENNQSKTEGTKRDLEDAKEQREKVEEELRVKKKQLQAERENSERLRKTDETEQTKKKLVAELQYKNSLRAELAVAQKELEKSLLETELLEREVAQRENDESEKVLARQLKGSFSNVNVEAVNKSHQDCMKLSEQIVEELRSEARTVIPDTNGLTDSD